MSSRRHARYSPLAADDDDGYDGNVGRQYDPRFDYSPKAFDKVPWKSIALAVFLLCLGCLLLFLSFFIFTGHMGGEKSQAYGLLVLGILSFLPGTQLIRQKVFLTGWCRKYVYLFMHLMYPLNWGFHLAT